MTIDETTSYVMTSLAWAMYGLALGFSLGLIVRLFLNDDRR